MSISTNSIINNEYLYIIKKPCLVSTEKLDINSLLKIEIIKNKIIEKKVFENKFGKVIKNISGYFCKRYKLNNVLLNKVNNTIFHDDYLPYLSQTFQSKSVEEVIKYLYLEYFMLTDLFNLQIISKEELSVFLTLSLSDKEEFIKNSNLLITNKQAFELTKENADKFISGKNKLLKTEIVSLFRELGIILIEIPQFYNLEALITFLNEIKNLKEKLKIENFSFKLRFKKLKHFKKDGMYIVNDKTIVVDPRKPKAFIHELGHYIFEENIKIEFNLKIIETKSNNIQKSKFETYSKESEFFAYSFEKMFID